MKNPNNESQSELTIREKIVIRLVLFVIQMIKPYEYEHQFTRYYEEMRELLGLKYKEK